MKRIEAGFVGVELYFENLERAKQFYVDTLGLGISDEQAGHHAKFDSSNGFICLERKGAESYPSKDKAVLFFGVPALKSAIDALGTGSYSVNLPGPSCTIPRDTTCFCCRDRRKADLTALRSAPKRASRHRALAWSRRRGPGRCSSSSYCA
jgi:predicted enzyme related to lactoylglutathione lyase